MPRAGFLAHLPVRHHPAEVGEVAEVAEAEAGKSPPFLPQTRQPPLIQQPQRFPALLGRKLR